MSEEAKKERNNYLKLYHALRFVEDMAVTTASWLFSYWQNAEGVHRLVRYPLMLLLFVVVFVCFPLSIGAEALAEMLAFSPGFRKRAKGWWVFAYFSGETYPSWQEGTSVMSDWLAKDSRDDPMCLMGRRVALVEFEDDGKWVQRDLQASWSWDR